MTSPRASKTKRRTRIQEEREELILEAALDVFSRHGFRGSTVDQIAEQAGMSKPNLLYYFPNKEDMHRLLIERLLDTWLDPLRKLDRLGEPETEIKAYIHRKLEMARDFPRQSRLFANEVLQGAPRIQEELQDLKTLVDEKVVILREWMAAGKLAKVDPYHLIFSIWATTQHYADFEAQIHTILGGSGAQEERFDQAANYLDHLFLNGLKPSK